MTFAETIFHSDSSVLDYSKILADGVLTLNDDILPIKCAGHLQSIDYRNPRGTHCGRVISRPSERNMCDKPVVTPNVTNFSGTDVWSASSGLCRMPLFN